LATTTLLQRHAGEGETIAEAIRDCLDYGKDPEKTESGKYISAYECDPATVADEFLLAKASYAAMTGREQKKENNVLCYQIRQSFYPGEITPKEANRIGYELAMRWTKGRHAFIVTTHTDKQHIHCHIYYNSTTPSLVLSFRQSAFLRSLGSAKHQPSLQHRGYAHQRNNNLLYEVSRPTFRRPLSMSYSPFRTSTGYIIVLYLE
jgi:hypothetical protein